MRFFNRRARFFASRPLITRVRVGQDEAVLSRTDKTWRLGDSVIGTTLREAAVVLNRIAFARRTRRRADAA